MSRRKTETLKSRNLRKEKRMILKGAMNGKKWQAFCQWLSRMGRKERSAGRYMVTGTRRTQSGKTVNKVRYVISKEQGE